MSQLSNRAAPTATSTRRKLITGVVVALGGLAVGSEVLGKSPPSMTEQPSPEKVKAPCAIHQEIELVASSQRIYEVLLDSKQFAAFSGEPAEIGREVGSAFSMFGRKIEGRNIDVVPGQRIVQAWRPADWGPGVYSVVKFELMKQGSHTKVVLDHTGFPDGTFEHLNAGWKLRYRDPLRKFFA